MLTSHRYYPSRYPKQDELVVVQITEVCEVGAYAELLEYAGIQGMIPITETTQRSVNSNRLRVGKIEVVAVMNVDEEKGYIDLTKKRMSTEDIERCKERWAKSKWIHSTLSRIDSPIEELYEYVWPLYEKYGHAYDAMMDWVEELESLPIRDFLYSAVNHRLKSSEVEIRADIDISCLRDGMDAIKTSLAHGKSIAPIRIQLESSPRYQLTLSASNRETGIYQMQQVCDAIQNKIKELGGVMDLKIAPRVV